MLSNNLKRIALMTLLATLVIAPVEVIVFLKIYRSRDSKAQHNDRYFCADNLKSLGRIFQEYSHLAVGSKYPPYSHEPGRLMVDTDLPFVAKQMAGYQGRNISLFLCPEDSDAILARGAWVAPWYREVHKSIDDRSYFYLGFVLYDDKDVALFADAYRERIFSGMSLDTEIELSDGVMAYEAIPRGVAQKYLYRIRPSLSRFLIEHFDMPTTADVSPWESNPYKEFNGTVPLLIERPENHATPGGHVLYLDGHVEFIRYPGKWPMTEKTIGLLLELDALGGKL